MHNSYGTKTNPRSTEVGSAVRPTHPGSKAGSGGAGSGSGPISSGTSGASGQGEAIARILLIAGGIISQLISDAEDQLANARACIEWYQNEEQKALRSIEYLRQLQGDANVNESDDSSTDE